MSATTVCDLLMQDADGAAATPCAFALPPPITESDLLCDEFTVLPEGPLAVTPAIPRAANVECSLLAYEKTQASPLCLKYVTAQCRKRYRAEVEETQEAHGLARGPDKTPSPPKRTKKQEEWLAWINWDHFA